MILFDEMPTGDDQAGAGDNAGDAGGQEGGDTGSDASEGEAAPAEGGNTEGGM